MHTAYHQFYCLPFYFPSYWILFYNIYNLDLLSLRNNKKLLFTCWAISLMTILQIVSSYLKQLLQGSVNATLGRFCCVFCPRKEVCRAKSCSMWLSHQLVGGRVRNGISVMSRPGPEDGSRHRCRLGGGDTDCSPLVFDNLNIDVKRCCTIFAIGPY